MDNSTTGAGDGVRAVERALAVLLAFREGDAGLSAAQLQERLPLSRPTLYRLLNALARSGFVQAEGEPRRFRLGPAAGQLARVWAAGARQPPDLPSAARPHMQALWEHTRETVSLFVPDGIDRVCVAELESPQALAFKRGVGYRERVLLGASGRVILAHRPHTPAELRRYAAGLPAARRLDLKAYAAELAATRRRGYAVSRSELIEGAVAMAAPVFGAQGAVVASLAVFGPSVRLGAARVKAVCGDLVREAGLLSQALGAPEAKDRPPAPRAAARRAS